MIQSEFKKPTVIEINIIFKVVQTIVIVFCFSKSFGSETKKENLNQTKKIISSKQTKTKSSELKKTKPPMAKKNKLNQTSAALEKIPVQVGASDASEIKVAPRPKINPGQLAIFKNGQYILISTIKVDALEVSSNCFDLKRQQIDTENSANTRNNSKDNKSKPSCTAYEIGQTKVTSLQSPTGQVSNPASTLCDQLLGKNFIAIDSKGSEFDYCGFNDGSFVDTWTLLSKVMQK